MGNPSWWERLTCYTCCKTTNGLESGPEPQLIDVTACINNEKMPMKCKYLSTTSSISMQAANDNELIERPEVEVDGGETYKGQWKGHLFHGVGCLRKKDGSVYEG